MGDYPDNSGGPDVIGKVFIGGMKGKPESEEESM